jgi:hypothetical protein
MILVEDDVAGDFFVLRIVLLTHLIMEEKDCCGSVQDNCASGWRRRISRDMVVDKRVKLSVRDRPRTHSARERCRIGGELIRVFPGLVIDSRR